MTGVDFAGDSWLETASAFLIIMRSEKASMNDQIVDVLRHTISFPSR